MKRLMIAAALILVTCTAFSQEYIAAPMHTRRGLELLGLSAGEIDEVLIIQDDAAAEVRRLQSDRERGEAELARLMTADNPNMRLIERTIRQIADTEADIRVVVIRRDIAVRQIVGTDRWARMVQTLRERGDAAAEEITGQIERQLRQLQEAIAEKQRQITELMEDRREDAQDEEIRRLFQEFVRQSEELQRLLRQRLQ